MGDGVGCFSLGIYLKRLTKLGRVRGLVRIFEPWSGDAPCVLSRPAAASRIRKGANAEFYVHAWS